MKLAIVSELIVDRLLEEFGFDQTPYLLHGSVHFARFCSLIMTVAPSNRLS